MVKVYLSLGGNTGNRFEAQQKAMECIAERVGYVVANSYLYETAPWGFEHKQDFLNQVIAVSTTLSPHDLLRVLMEIEEELGRKRTGNAGYKARSIDIDILFYGNKEVHEGGLTVPHPRLHERRFILVPLKDIAPELEHPVLHRTIAELLAACPDKLSVNQYEVLQN